MSDAATDHELLTQVDGIGPGRATALLDHFDSGRTVAQSACRYWAELIEVEGISEAEARALFDKLHDADVFHDLRGY